MSLQETIDIADKLVRENPTGGGIGSEGLLISSDDPINRIPRYDPKNFVVSPKKFKNKLLDMKTKYRLNTPISIMIFFTNRCSTDCCYCYAERRVVEELTLEEWIPILQQIQDLGIRIIALTGGDVFARHDGADFIVELLRQNFHFMVSTKDLVTRTDAERIQKAGFLDKVNGAVERVFQLSIDAVDSQIVEQMTGRKNFLTRIQTSFENLMEVGIVPKIKCVLTPLNVDQPRKIVERFEPLGARRFHFVHYGRSFYRHHDDFFLNIDLATQLAKDLAELASDYPNIKIFENITQYCRRSQPVSGEERDRRWIDRTGCAGGWQMIGITAGGKTILCEQMLQDDYFFVGDVRKQSIMDIWKSDQLLDFIFPPKEKFRNSICYECTEFEDCHWEKGYCYRDAFFSYETLYDAPPQCPKQTKPGMRMD